MTKGRLECRQNKLELFRHIYLNKYKEKKIGIQLTTITDEKQNKMDQQINSKIK
jgi:hypothetical protein